MNTLPKLPYKYGTYKGVVIHEVGEDNRTLQQWVDRMYDTYNTAFVHAFVDNKEFILPHHLNTTFGVQAKRLIHIFIR